MSATPSPPATVQLVELPAEEERSLAALHPEWTSDTQLILIATEDHDFAKALRLAVERHSLGPHDAAYLDHLVETIAPQVHIPTPTILLQARRNALARTQLLEEFGGLTSHQVADLAGSKAKNRAAQAAKYKAQGKLFSVELGGQTLFPGFQFDDEGQLVPVVSDVLAILHPQRTDWEIALWFTAANGWLDGRRPVDLLATESEAVVNAARHEMDDIDG